VILLEVADDGFDGGATAHLTADGLGDTPDLAADPDLEPVRIVVADQQGWRRYAGSVLANRGKHYLYGAGR